MKKPFKEFLQVVKRDCKENGYRFLMCKGKYVTTSNIKTSGYFSDKPKVLAVAMGSADYKLILAHEYSHLTQVKDKVVLWDLCEESSVKLDDWLNGKEVKDIKIHVSIVRSLELDNEMRTAKLMDVYDFGISKEDYTRKANAYIMFHNWILITRKWSRVGNHASTNQRIMAAMSDKFDMDYSKLSPKLKKIFREEGI